MKKARMEAFSDGVLAIIITIMVLELKVPHGDQLSDLSPLIPVFLSYVLSFLYLAIYWNNHHHLLQIAKHVNGRVLWANTLLLFWLSLIPFVTAWSGENHFTAIPVVAYGLVLTMAGISYLFLTKTLIAVNGKDSALAHAVGKDFKGKISIVIYIIAFIIACSFPIVALSLYCAIALLWLIPDSRIERRLENEFHLNPSKEQ